MKVVKMELEDFRKLVKKVERDADKYYDLTRSPEAQDERDAARLALEWIESALDGDTSWSHLWGEELASEMEALDTDEDDDGDEE